ncbi:MAG TPA: YqgE/AlgH family protein [Acidimicrobiales bacterium]|nr:YqgE/AlgH family protein [Acidimicrobiales bacterium]
MAAGSRGLKGRLLIANPVLPDPNFDRTVVLLVAHQDDSGALGLVLNRPSQLDVGSPLPRWEPLSAEPRVVFVGGPVAPSAAICLARVVPGGAATGWTPVLGELGTLDLEQDPDDLGDWVAQIRVFAGYAGWQPGQLEGEIEAGAWFVVDAEPSDAMADDPEQLWKQVLRRQGAALAMVATFPPDLSSN